MLQSVKGIGASKEGRIVAGAEEFLEVAAMQPGLDYGEKVSRPRSAPAAADVSSKPAAVPAVVTPRQRLAATLRCPICGHDGLDLRSALLTCSACRREYNFQSGVADLAPPTQPTRNLSQRLMETKAYAKFYEDLMRPRLTHVVSERTMREEYALSAELLELDDRQDVRLLDIACGTGNFTRYFAQRLVGKPDFLLAGVDLSWPMLETARSYIRREGLENRVFLVRGNAIHLPLQTRAFNTLHCSGALHMFDDIDGALRSFARVLEPGGVCVIGTFVLGEGVLRRAVKRAAEIPTKFHWFTQKELFHRLEAAGFDVVSHDREGDAITVKAIRA